MEMILKIKPSSLPNTNNTARNSNSFGRCFVFGVVVAHIMAFVLVG